MQKETVYFFVSISTLLLGYLGINHYYGKQATEAASATVQATPTLSVNAPDAAPPSPVAAAAPVGTPASAVPAQNPASPQAAAVPAPYSGQPPLVPAADLVLENPSLRIEFSQTGGCITRAALKDYKENSQRNEPAELFPGHLACKALGIAVDANDLRERPSWLERSGPRSLRLVQRQGELLIARAFEIAESGYGTKMQLSLQNLGASDVRVGVAMELGAISEDKDAGGMLSGAPMQFREALFMEPGEKVSREHLTFQSTPESKSILQKNGMQPDWIGTGSLYFLFALLPQQREPLDVSVLATGYNIQPNPTAPADHTLYEAWLKSAVNLAPGAHKVFDYQLYSGPKSKAVLDAFSDRKLAESIDFGFFRLVAWPMFHSMKFLKDLTGNWGWAIILLTLVINIVFLPLNIKAFHSGKQMQKIQPELNALREKYKDDKQKLQQEQMALMSQKGMNPLSGCLPILPQIPVFFGLNAVLTHTFELRQAPFGLWIQDLSARDPLFISPLIMACLMFVQQKLTPMPSMDPTQQKIMQFLPIVFAVFMLAYPSGLVVYIVTNTVFSLVRMQVLMRKYKDA